MGEKLPTVIREKCGTRSGYQKHSYEGEHSCEPCKVANSARFREWYKTAADKERARYQKNLQNPTYATAQHENRFRWQHKSRAIKRGVASEDWTLPQLLEKYGTDCHICGNPVDLDAPRHAKDGTEWHFGLQVDHVIPFSRGGDNTLDNVRPAHAVCNMSKRSNLIEEIEKDKKATV